MPNLTNVNVAEWSLAAIAVAFLIAVIALLPALMQVRRTARQAEQMLVSINSALPGLLSDLRDVVRKLGEAAGTLQDLAAAMDRLGQLAAATGRAVEHVRDVIVPSVASAAGVVAALREGFQWMRSSRNRGRDES